MGTREIRYPGIVVEQRAEPFLAISICERHQSHAVTSV
jgi:hypothetical protein